MLAHERLSVAHAGGPTRAEAQSMGNIAQRSNLNPNHK